MKRIVVYIMALLVFFSCKKTIPVDENYHKPRTVLNSVFSADNYQISVYVTESQAVYGFHKYYKMVDDAQLALYKNDEKIGDFALSSDSIVRSEYSPGYGAKYDIELDEYDLNAVYAIGFEHETMGEAYAETSFPVDVEVDSIVLDVRQYMDYDYTVNKLVANVTFNDPPGKNYYQIYSGGIRMAKAKRRYMYNDEKGYDEAVYTDTLYFTTYASPPAYNQVDPLLKPKEDGVFGYVENQFMIFNDELIDGQSYTLQVVLYDYCDENFLEEFDTLAGEMLSYSVGLRTISEELYLYYKSLDAFFWNDGSPFAEPVQVFSNVENGVGIVATYAECKNTSGAYGSIDTSKVYLAREYY